MNKFSECLFEITGNAVLYYGVGVITVTYHDTPRHTNPNPKPKHNPNP